MLWRSHTVIQRWGGFAADGGAQLVHRVSVFGDCRFGVRCVDREVLSFASVVVDSDLIAVGETVAERYSSA